MSNMSVQTHKPSYMSPVGQGRPHGVADPIQHQPRVLVRVTVRGGVTAKIPGLPGRLKWPGFPERSTEPHVHDVVIYKDWLPVIEDQVETHLDEWEASVMEYHEAFRTHAETVTKMEVDLPENLHDDYDSAWKAALLQQGVDETTWRNIISTFNASINPGAFFQQRSKRWAASEEFHRILWPDSGMMYRVDKVRRRRGAPNHMLAAGMGTRRDVMRGVLPLLSVEVIKDLPPPVDQHQSQLVDIIKAAGLGGANVPIHDLVAEMKALRAEMEDIKAERDLLKEESEKPKRK